MPPKKIKQQSFSQGDMYVVLNDSKTSIHLVVPRDQLVYSKKDDLKVGTFATFNGGGEGTSRCRGTVIMSGSEEQCDASVSLVEKSNYNNQGSDGKNTSLNKKSNNKKKELNEVESDSSDHLIIDEHTEENERDDDREEELENEGEISVNMPVSQVVDDANFANKNSTMPLITVSSNNQSSLALPLTTSSSCAAILTEINDNTVEKQKRKEVSEDSTSSNKRTKRAGKVSHSAHEKVVRENTQLKKEIAMYRNNWMPRPTGAVAMYFVNIGKNVSGASFDNEDSDVKAGRLEHITIVLDMSEKELKSCEHDTDITKTCRQIIKHIYSNPKERASMLMSSMENDILEAVQDYTRMAHSLQAKTANSILNNAIGNVFATEKREQEKN